MGAEAIKDAFSAADLFMQDEEQRLAYVNREMAIMDYQSDMKSYRGGKRRRERRFDQKPSDSWHTHRVHTKSNGMDRRSYFSIEKLNPTTLCRTTAIRPNQ